MRNLWVLYCKEVKTFFISPVAYLVMFFCYFLNGYLFVNWMDFMTDERVKDYTIFQVMMNSGFLWFTLLPQVPIITMRSLSEEYKMGTIEMLLTAPVREWEIVLSKFGATMTLFVLIWASLPLNLGFIQWFSTTANVFSWGMICLPLMMLVLVGSLYVSVGIFTSSLSRNQMVSAVFSFVLILIMFCVPIFGNVHPGSQMHDELLYVSASDHMATASLGIFDSRPLIYYLSGTIFFLFLTERILEGRRLKS